MPQNAQKNPGPASRMYWSIKQNREVYIPKVHNEVLDNHRASARAHDLYLRVLKSISAEPIEFIPIVFIGTLSALPFCR